MKRKELVDRHRFPNIGHYYQHILPEFDEDPEDYASGEEFRYSVLENSDSTQTVNGIKRDIITIVIETPEDLPFKEEDLILLNQHDMISLFGEDRNKREITGVEYSKSNVYNRIKSKYPNRQSDIRVKKIFLK